jgi:hypothetical protein
MGKMPFHICKDAGVFKKCRYKDSFLLFYVAFCVLSEKELTLYFLNSS